MLETIPHQRLTRILDETAAELLESARCRGPAVDALHVARRLGLTVARDRKLNGRARFARLAIGRGRALGAIFIGEADRPERLQWAVAHELGEISAHRVFAELHLPVEEEPPGLREQLANELARRILLPMRPFQAAGRDCNWDLFELKSVFSTASHELVARRMLDLDTPAIVTVCDHGRISWRRRNQPGPVPAPSSPERLLMRVAHDTAEFQQQRSGGLEIRAWPVHEPDWKREILRTEPLQDQ
jgi:hypothetical protein